MPGPYASLHDRDRQARHVQLRGRGPAQALVSARASPRSKARLAYYGERFDTVEVDSPYYHLPDPEVTGRWAQRTPPEFVFHVKAHATMTGHQEPVGGLEQAFADFRASLEPLELSGKLKGILLQYHPRFVKSDDAKDELSRVRALLDPLVPLVEFRHRSWLDEDERADTLAFLERHGLAYVSVDAPPTRASNVLPPVAAATHRVAYVRFHGRNVKTWNIKAEKSSERFNWMYSPEELGRVGGEARPADRGRGRGVRAVQQQPRRLRPAQRASASRPARRGRNPCGGRHRAASARADAVLVRKIGIRSRGFRSRENDPFMWSPRATTPGCEVACLS